MALQETKLTSKDRFQVRGYHTLRADRGRGRRADTTAGGGVAILVKEGTPYTVLNERVKADEDETTDALFVEIGGLRVVNIYIPPIRAGGGDTRTQLFSPNPWPRDRNVIICGDVNGHSRHGIPTPKKMRSARKLMSGQQRIVSW